MISYHKNRNVSMKSCLKIHVNIPESFLPVTFPVHLRQEAALILCMCASRICSPVFSGLQKCMGNRIMRFVPENG